jgi:hypothetical protein
MKKPQVDASKIYMNAERYRIADNVLRAAGQNDPSLMNVIAGPQMMISVFAIELYLKCLLCLETGTLAQTHNLKALFRDLSVATRTRIEQLWNDHTPSLEPYFAVLEQTLGKPIPRDFITRLDMSSRALTELRDIHEDESGAFLVGDLPPMLRAVILEKRPLWAGFHHAPPASLPHGMSPTTPGAA